MASSPSVADILADVRLCNLICPGSRNQHVHFPDGFETFVARLVGAAAAVELPQPAPDPSVDAIQRWAVAFATAWQAFSDRGATDDAARVKAAEIAAAAVGLGAV